MKNYYKPSRLFPTLFFIVSSVCADDFKEAKGETEWTLGAGLGVFNYKLYPGAKKSDQLVLPVPYFTYRSPKFEIDRGIKSFIYNSEEMVVDISADFGLPVDSDDTEARQGMPDLDFVLQLGPSLEFLLNDKKTNYFDVRFEVPARVAFVASFNDSENIGYLIEPRLSFNHHRSSRNGLSHKATIGLKFATQKFNAYYYDVAEKFATATRAEYKSNGGFAGSFVNYRMAYNKDDLVYWAFVRYQSLRGAEFEDSPLVLQNDYYFFGAGISWIFARSL
ncbi:putative outer membrane protein [hydrothermal vent metagenome]|uniref:Putative outer membrane protein n=1 Tax=hydrothermal vent metagenome TaxID=652676 RepID=A0A3B0X2D5_9ZZZZ